MNPDELIVNIQCVEHGIVPIAGMTIDHVEKSLSDLDHDERRICTRKFRKILKKAIRYHASEYYTPGTDRHQSHIDQLCKSTGLNRKKRGFVFTKKERSFRQGLVIRYLSRVAT
jgi:hypothetical protein